MQKYFISLDPDEQLSRIIKIKKDLVLILAGDQNYLSHPPHFTLFLMTSDNENEILKKLGELSDKISNFHINRLEPHIFYEDIQTGGNTLVYNLDETSSEKFKKIQLAVINNLNELNTKQFFKDVSMINFSPIEKQNIERYSFPYVGENWTPHITVASIKKENFNFVYEKLNMNKISGNFLISSMSLYKLNPEPVLIKRFKLK